MSDRLKLSDPGAREKTTDNTVTTAEQAALDKRVKELETQNAQLEELIAKQKKHAQMQQDANKLGARKNANFKAISTAPSINKTPIGPTMVPLPYPTVQDLASSINTARTVNFNGCPVYLLNASTQPACKGDEPGTGKGIRSGTVSGEVKPVNGCKTVRIEGKQVVREGDACTMNGGNNPGIYVVSPSPSPAPPATAIQTSNPDSVRTNNKTLETPLLLEESLPLAEKVLIKAYRDAIKGTAATQRTMSLLAPKPQGQFLTTAPPVGAEQSTLRTRNTLTMFLLGPFGAAAATARLSGQNEQTVAAANEVGAAAMGVVGSLSGYPSRQPLSVVPTVTSRGAIPGVRITGGVLASIPTRIDPIPISTISQKADTEIGLLRKLARDLGGSSPKTGERSLTRDQYNKMISKYRSKGYFLKKQLQETISQQQYVYRATTLRAVEIYRNQGNISGRNGSDVYMSTDYVGTNQRNIMNRSQVFEHWGAPEVLLKIPTSELKNASVPRPFGGNLSIGWEPKTEAYPAAGSGGMNQFLGSTKSWSDSWIIPLKKAEVK